MRRDGCEYRPFPPPSLLSLSLSHTHSHHQEFLHAFLLVLAAIKAKYGTSHCIHSDGQTVCVVLMTCGGDGESILQYHCN